MPTVRLTWGDPNSGVRQEDEVHIYRSESPFDIGTLPAIHATLPADSTQFEDDTVLDDATYYYGVVAVRGSQLAGSFTGPVLIGAPIGNTIFGVTIAAGKVSADLTDFPVMVDLSLMPASFWSGVNKYGGNIRAYASAGGVEYPLDISSFHHNAQDGTLWVKVPLITAAGGASFILELGPPEQQRAPRSGTFGSAAVWSDYHSVFLGGENTDDRASTSRVIPVQGDGATFLNVGNPEMTFAADPHQGFTWHRESGEVYTSDNNVLRRYDASGTLLTSNTNPNADIMAATGMTGLIHLCDICIVGDWLIVPTNDFPSTSKCAMAVFDRTTLALVAATDVSAIDTQISGVCWNPDVGRLFTCKWGIMLGLKSWTLDAGTGAIANVSGIAFSPPLAAADLNNRIQGVEYWRGHYWLVDDSRDEVIRVKADGAIDLDDCPIQFSDNSADSVSGNYEGICVYKDGLAVLVDPSSANSYMIYARPANFDMGGGGARYGTNNGYFQATGLTGSTTFTMSVSGARSAAKQAAMATYRDLSAGSTNDRVTIAQRFVTPNYRIEAWDDVNSWLSPGTPVNAATGVWNRVAVVYNGTSRELFIDGTSRASQAGITPRDAGFSAFSIGIDDETNAESFDGDISFAYIRHGVLTAAWLAAEHLMLSNPAGFYDISGDP